MSESTRIEKARKEHLTRVDHSKPERPVLGEKILRWFHTRWAHFNQKLQEYIPEELNPFAQTGAIANLTFIVAIVSGILLLFWYVPAANQAYSSLENMKGTSAQIIRSLHRYSSDICLFFVMLHALEFFLARRFGGPRWLAWVSGVVLFGVMWLAGWSGYWLVWDERGKHAMVGTAKLLDLLPLFSDSLVRTFVTQQSISSLFFFVIFFLHILIPLAIGIVLWLHLSRINQARYITGKRMTISVLLALLVLSLAAPAYSVAPSTLNVISQKFALDWFYLWPLVLIDHLSEGIVWGTIMAVLCLIISLPWWTIKRYKSPAHILENRCNGCTQCYQDCPYNAISMVNKEGNSIAQVDPAKCVSCGICVGGCNPGAIIFPRLPVQDVRETINKWLGEVLEHEQKPIIAFLCASSVGSDLEIAPNGNCAAMPGYKVLPVPCSGWVHPLIIERALRRGARGVLVAGCGPERIYRMGDEHAKERLAGERGVTRTSKKMDKTKVRFVCYDRASRNEFLQSVQEFQQGISGATTSYSRIRLAIVVAVIWSVLAGIVYFLNKVEYPVPITNQTELIVSFKHSGKIIGKKDKKTHPNIPVMRKKRHPVFMRVLLDGKEILKKKYPPAGLHQDGSSSAMEQIPISPGLHLIKVEISNTGNDKDFEYHDQKQMRFERYRRHVVIFSKKEGFVWN